MIITGNPNYGLAQALHELYPDAQFFSRSTGYDLCTGKGQHDFAEKAVSISANDESIIINAALWKFNQTVLLDIVYKECIKMGKKPHIITIGSTTDRVKKGGSWLYNAEKKALRDYSNTLAINGVWSDNAPKITYISFGTLSNNQAKHPTRKCLDIRQAALYIQWIINQPRHIAINEISIDPIQHE